MNARCDSPGAEGSSRTCATCTGERLLCYCLGETESGIRSEIVEHGRTDVVARIREHIAAQRCACDVRNPRGTCCLGEVMAAVKRIEGAMLSVKED